MNAARRESTPGRPVVGARCAAAIAAALLLVAGAPAVATDPLDDAARPAPADADDPVRRVFESPEDEPLVLDGIDAVAIPADPVADLPAERMQDDPGQDQKAAALQQRDELEARRTALESIEDEAAEHATPATLPAPCTGPWDWVQLSSGEWLRGDFKRMRKKRFEMRSTRMKRQSMDWKHVRAFCFPGNTRFILDDRTVLSGHGRLENDTLIVTSDGLTQKAPRKDIWAMLPGLPREINRWRSTVSVGLDSYSGNTNSNNVSSAVSVDREDSTTHFHIDYRGSFGEVDGQPNVARNSVAQSTNVYFTRRWYASLPFVDYTSDRFQNIQSRVNPGLSLGVELFDRDTFEWSFNTGLAYQYTQYISADPLRENDWGPRFATDIEWDIVTDLTLKISHQTVLLTRDFDNSSFNTSSDLTYEITDLLYVQFGFWYNRIKAPRPTTAGVTPDPNDLHWLASIGLSFD